MEAGRALDTQRDLGESRHICAFFNGLEEQHRVLRTFIRDGLDRGDRAFHLVDPDQHSEHLRRLRDGQIGVEAAIRSGQLMVEVWQPGAPGSRRFEPESWLESFRQALEAGPTAGYAHTRFLGQMGWAHEDPSDEADWFEFEARLNGVLVEHQDSVICAYDLTAISAGVVIDALRTHPAVILGGLLQENPFYVPPDQFVAEIKERRAQLAHAPTGL